MGCVYIVSYRPKSISIVIYLCIYMYILTIFLGYRALSQIEDILLHIKTEIQNKDIMTITIRIMEYSILSKYIAINIRNNRVSHSRLIPFIHCLREYGITYAPKIFQNGYDLVFE